jgi:hypothetical protein
LCQKYHTKKAIHLIQLNLKQNKTKNANYSHNQLFRHFQMFAVCISLAVQLNISSWLLCLVSWHLGHPWASWVFLGILGHPMVSLGILGHPWASLGILELRASLGILGHLGYLWHLGNLGHMGILGIFGFLASQLLGILASWWHLGFLVVSWLLGGILASWHRIE